ncbi:hypothetical protein [Deinococcus pimensis]|uniref:hypothetical protein n=1 Tax=Deinococcus pimensis TaxID=309888 RepID=UPI00048291CB|nr:hypothetical protein [Deinococcus pimensis]
MTTADTHAWTRLLLPAQQRQLTWLVQHQYIVHCDTTPPDPTTSNPPTYHLAVARADRTVATHEGHHLPSVFAAMYQSVCRQAHPRRPLDLHF